MEDYELRIDGAGPIWKHTINRKGRVLECGTRVADVAAAEALVGRGEARWQVKKEYVRRDRRTREQYVQDLADTSPAAIQPADWSHAMNRDE